MLKLCEEEKIQNKELCDYEIKLKNNETRRLLESMRGDHFVEITKTQKEKENAILALKQCFEKVRFVLRRGSLLTIR